MRKLPNSPASDTGDPLQVCAFDLPGRIRRCVPVEDSNLEPVS